MGVKTYSRKEYLRWCKERGIKNPLPENKRNRLTESGYPVLINQEIIKEILKTI